MLDPDYRIHTFHKYPLTILPCLNLSIFKFRCLISWCLIWISGFMLSTTTAPFHFTLPRYQGVWFWFWLNTLIKSSLLAVVPCLISCVWSWLQGQNSVCPPSNFTFAQIMPPYIHCLALISQVLDPHFREHTMLKSSLLSIFPFPYFRVHNRVVIKGRVQKKKIIMENSI